MATKTLATVLAHLTWYANHLAYDVANFVDVRTLILGAVL